MKLKRIYNEIFNTPINLLEERTKINKLLVLLEREIKVGDNLTNKLKKVNNDLTRKMLTFLNSDKIKDVNVDYVDYNSEDEQQLSLGFTDAKGNERIRKVKIIKLLKYLGANIDDIKGYDIEELVSHLKKGDIDNFKIVAGDDILKAYHCENYDEGETMGSCMRYEYAQKYLEIYTQNPKQISCLVLFNPENGKVRGRALIWSLDDGGTFIDRVYTTNNEYEKDFNGGEFEYYPYMDTFTYYTPESDELSTSYGELELQDLNGSDSSGIFSEYHGERIPEDEAFYVEHMGDYFYYTEISPNWNGDGFVFIDSEDVVTIDKGEYAGEYALSDVTVEDYNGETILHEESYTIEAGDYEGGYAHEDDIINDFRDRIIVRNKAISATIGIAYGEVILVDDAFIFTSGPNKGKIFHEDDKDEIKDDSEFDYVNRVLNPNDYELHENTKNIIKRFLNEELKYRYSNTKGAEDDEYEIGVKESISLPNLRLTNNFKLMDDEKSKISNLTPEQLILKQGDYDGKILNMVVKVPWTSEINNGGIVADIQIVNDQLYQIHIEISEVIRGLGLGYKIYVALIKDLGHLYSGKGRRHNNDEIPKIWSKLNSEPDFECYKNKIGDLCVFKKNPNKNSIIKLFNN